MLPGQPSGASAKIRVMREATFGLVACEVFEEEIAHLRSHHREQDRIGPSVWLEMGLHDRPDHLREEVRKAILQIEKEERLEKILLAYGLCGNGLAGVQAGRCPLVMPRAHDCISVFLGSAARHAEVLRKNPGTYFYSPGWIRGRRVPGPDRETWLREVYGERYRDDPEMIEELIDADREAFEHHGCAAYVDLTDNKEAEGYCKNCARHLGWEYERLQGDAAFLRDLLFGPHEEARFVVVSPGGVLRLDLSEKIPSQIPGAG